MREALGWKEADIQRLADDGVEEDHYLEFKACDALRPSPNPNKNYKEEIGIDIATFANAAGGTILYGMKEKQGGVADEIDDGFDPDKTRKEWLEQVIRSNVEPPLDDVRVKPVHLSGARAGRVVYIVSIPQGKTAHQSKDGRYWRRDGSGKRFLHNDEIDDLKRRGDAPDLHIELMLGAVAEDHGDGDHRAPGLTLPRFLHVVLVNQTDTPPQYVQIRLFFDPSIRVPRVSTLKAVGKQWLELDGHKIVTNAFVGEWGSPSAAPVWRGVPRECLASPPWVQFPPGIGRSFFVGWEVHAPRMLPKRGYYTTPQFETDSLSPGRGEWQIAEP